jgi:hypothetical protein
MDVSLRRDTVNARGVSDAAVNLLAHSKPPARTRVDSLLWELYCGALVALALWLVLFGLALLALSTAATWARPMVAPLGRLPEFVTPDVSGTDTPDGGNVWQTCSPDRPN